MAEQGERISTLRQVWSRFTSSSKSASLLEPAARPELPSPQAAPVATPAPVRGRLKKVLIVDDNPVVLEALRFKLEAVGYQVVTAVDGAAAVGSVRKQKPDLMLLDLSFPPDVAHGGTVNWDGFLIMSWLARLEEAKHIPIVVVSAGDPARYRARCLALGAVAFFQKPINVKELLSVISRTQDQGTVGRTAGEGDYVI